jgi:hypothetical protein
VKRQPIAIIIVHGAEMHTDTAFKIRDRLLSSGGRGCCVGCWSEPQQCYAGVRA